MRKTTKRTYRKKNKRKSRKILRGGGITEALLSVVPGSFVIALIKRGLKTFKGTIIEQISGDIKKYKEGIIVVLNKIDGKIDENDVFYQKNKEQIETLRKLIPIFSKGSNMEETLGTIFDEGLNAVSTILFNNKSDILELIKEPDANNDLKRFAYSLLDSTDISKFKLFLETNTKFKTTVEGLKKTVRENVDKTEEEAAEAEAAAEATEATEATEAAAEATEATEATEPDGDSSVTPVVSPVEPDGDSSVTPVVSPVEPDGDSSVTPVVSPVEPDGDSPVKSVVSLVETATPPASTPATTPSDLGASEISNDKLEGGTRKGKKLRKTRRRKKLTRGRRKM